MKKLLTATAGAVLLGTVLGFSSGVLAPNFKEIYVFGDSLSDVGNVSKAEKGDVPPSPPYFQGRYADGPVWVEYLASKLKLTSNPNTNYAFGGATTGDFKGIPPGLLAQIKEFTATNSSADPNALYIVWAGANDYLGHVTDSTTPIKNLTTAVKLLSAVGAKNIVVVNLPDLGKLPITRNSQRASSLTALTKKHNSELAASLNSLRQTLKSDTKITYFDVSFPFDQAIATPEKFGFTNVTKPCLTKVSICDNPNEYLFWDSIHPTTAAHKFFLESTFPALTVSAPPVVFTSKQTLVLSVFVFGTLGASLFLILERKKATSKRL